MYFGGCEPVQEDSCGLSPCLRQGHSERPRIAKGHGGVALQSCGSVTDAAANALVTVAASGNKSLVPSMKAPTK